MATISTRHKLYVYGSTYQATITRPEHQPYAGGTVTVDMDGEMVKLHVGPLTTDATGYPARVVEEAGRRVLCQCQGEMGARDVAEAVADYLERCA